MGAFDFGGQASAKGRHNSRHLFDLLVRDRFEGTADS